MRWIVLESRCIAVKDIDIRMIDLELCKVFGKRFSILLNSKEFIEQANKLYNRDGGEDEI